MFSFTMKENTCQDERETWRLLCSPHDSCLPGTGWTRKSQYLAFLLAGFINDPGLIIFRDGCRNRGDRLRQEECIRCCVWRHCAVILSRNASITIATVGARQTAAVCWCAEIWNRLRRSATQGVEWLETQINIQQVYAKQCSGKWC